MLIYVVTPIEESKSQSMTRLICNLIVSQGHVPVAPRLYFPQFTQDDRAPQEEAMMSVCDEAWAVGERDDRMMDEMETARRLFLNVRHFKDLPALAEALEALKNKDSNVKPAQETDNLEESLEKGDIIGTIAEYCVDQMPSVVNRTHVDSKTVLRIMFLSNCLRWKCRKIVRSDRFPEWWKTHIIEIGKALGLWEGLVVLVLRAELEALLEDADDQD